MAGWRDRARPVQVVQEQPGPAGGAGAAAGWRSRARRAHPQQSVVGTGEALGRGALQGVTAGFADELGAGIQAGLARLSGDPEMQAGDVYRQARKENRGFDAKAQKDQGGAYLAGNVGGALATSLVIPGGGLAGAAAQGAVTGLGTSDADLTKGEIGAAALDTTLGAGTGAIGQKLASGLGRVVGGAADRVAPVLRGFAEKRAVKALGARQSDLAKMRPEQIREMARTALDSGLVRFGSRVDAIAPRAKAANEAAGKALGDVLGGADEAGARFDVNRLRARLAKELASKAKGNPIREAQLKEAMAASRLGDLDTSAGFRQANDINAAMSEGLFNKLEAEGKKRFLRQIAGIMSDEMDEQIGRAAGPKARAALEAANRNYGATRDAAKISARGVKALEGNRWLSPSDYGVGLAAGAGGILAGGPAGIGWGLLAPLAHKLLRERGASSLAVGADAASAAARGIDGTAVERLLSVILRTPEGQKWWRTRQAGQAPSR